MTTAVPVEIPSHTEILVIGSGAGGAATAATLAERGYEVLVLEEGPDEDTGNVATNSPDAIARLYRNGGMTPILGTPNIAYVEGRCLGGSTEVNSAFWHRLPDDCYERWSRRYGVTGLSADALSPYFEALETQLSVSRIGAAPLPKSSQVFREGLEKMGWEHMEVPRCQRDDPSKSPFAPGNKQSMQRTFLPRARAAGARIVTSCKATRLHCRGGRAVDVEVRRQEHTVRISAESVFVCAGAVQSAALLRRSGITHNVGDNLCIHPMLKAAATFDETVDAHDAVLPVFQVKEFWPDIAIGGSVFTPGFLAMLLADNWGDTAEVMKEWRQAALFYTATRGTARGKIRPVPGSADGVVVRYSASETDRTNLSRGLARLGEALFAAGAKALYPSVRSHSVLRSAAECKVFDKQPPPLTAMSLSTVHAFSSCPMGEDTQQTATDSFGKVHGFENLYINDASLLPDSPGVNPQGSIMAIALRNVDHFDEQRRGAQ